MRIDATDVADYLDQVPVERRPAIELIGHRVKALVPGVEETLEHAMPTYTVDGHSFMAVASQQHHVSVYVVGLDHTLATDPVVADHFAGIGCGKNCLRVTKTKLDRLNTTAVDALVEATLDWVSTNRR